MSSRKVPALLLDCNSYYSGTEEMSSVCDLKLQQRESSVSPGEIGARCVATPTGSWSTPQHGDGADMVECVATLVVNGYVYKLPSVVRDMSSSHVRAEIAQWDS